MTPLEKFCKKFNLEFEDDWHITKPMSQWPKVSDDEFKRRILATDLERSKGCVRPLIAPCKDEWFKVKLYFRGKDKPATWKYCNKHMGHLFGWCAPGASRYEIFNQQGKLTDSGWDSGGE